MYCPGIACKHGSNVRRVSRSAGIERTLTIENQYFVASPSRIVCRNLDSKFLHRYFFDTIQVRIKAPERLREIAEEQGMNFFYSEKNIVSISIGEVSTQRDMVDILAVFATLSDQDETATLFDYSQVEEYILHRTKPAFNLSDASGVQYTSQ